MPSARAREREHRERSHDPYRSRGREQQERVEPCEQTCDGRAARARGRAQRGADGEHLRDDVVGALTRVAAGGSVLDPEVVARLLGRQVRDDPLSALSAGQLDVLAAMAEGRSNSGIAEAMYVSEAAVEKHVTALFRALDLPPSPGRHRRVQAVLVYLRAVGRR